MSGSSECVALTSASARALTLGSTGGVIIVDFIDRRGLGFLLRRLVCPTAGPPAPDGSRFRAPAPVRAAPARPTRISGGLCSSMIHRVIEAALGRFQVPGLEFFLSRLVFLLGVRDQIGDRVWIGLSCSLGLFGRNWRWIRSGERPPGARQSAPAHWLAVPAAFPGADRCGRPCRPEPGPAPARSTA